MTHTTHDNDTDNDIRGMFADFKPDLSDNSLFMSRLRHALDSVEIVKQHNLQQRARSRRAIAVAGVAGVAMGVIFALLMPHILRIMAQMGPYLSGSYVGDMLLENARWVAWAFAFGASLIISLNAYHLSLLLQKPR